MVPTDLQDKLAAFVNRLQPVIADLIKRIIASGRSPEDQIFVIAAEDAASQEVASVMFGLEKAAKVGPLPKGWVVGKADFFASVGQTLERCEPDICRLFHQRNRGEVMILAVIDGYFCGVSLFFPPPGRSMPKA